jgi:uncharacterized membrane protein
MVREKSLRTESGLRRVVNFSGAVVAIAITLLILPLVDAASSIGTTGLGHFFSHNKDGLLAFALSFTVIGDFWWGQHQTFEHVEKYNVVLIWGMFLWLFSIVFLPFPTELIGSASNGDTAVHGIYVGTMLLASVGGLIQQWSIVRWDLQDESFRGKTNVDSALVIAVLMAVALVLVVAAPKLGLWPLLLLVLARPSQRVMARTRRRRQEEEQLG